MRKRPLSITIISWLFIVVGVVALVYHSTHGKEDNILWILFVRFLALVCGVGMLFRQGWARRLTAAWLGYHVYLSIGHEAGKLIVHALLFVVIAFFLFRRSSAAYFQRGPATSES
jgi:hypothetical protein